MTEIYNEFTDSILKRIVKIIDNGGIVCFPTETVYTLAADASNDEAVKKMYSIKRINNNKPFSVLVGDIYQARRIAHFNKQADELALRYFPGPLTLVLNVKEHNNLSPLLNAEFGTVGVRMPNNVNSLKIIKAVGRPIIGSSANLLSSSRHATSAKEVIESIGDKIDLVIDMGSTDLNIQSTVVEIISENPRILREGAIRSSAITKILEKVR